MSIVITSKGHSPECSIIWNDLAFEALPDKPDKQLAFESIIKLDQEFFPRPWAPSRWTEITQYPERYLLFYGHANHQVLAFALYSLSCHESLAHLLKILVIPPMGSKGLGAELLAYSFRHLAKKNYSKYYLEVEKDNQVAIKLYKSLKLQVIREAHNYYGTGEDGLIMMLDKTISF